MIIGIVGLGLIGGSMAKSINRLQGHTVYGYDIDETVIRKAVMLKAAERELSRENIGECDILIIAVRPGDAVRFVEKNRGLIRKEAVVMDTCGVKTSVAEGILPIAHENGFYFVGGHPMAGAEKGGFDMSDKDLFNGASMIITPQKGIPIAILDSLYKLFRSMGFSSVRSCGADEHDRIIAYTSQLAHIVSNAFAKSPTAAKRAGFTGGSYRDMTRVADMDESMWSELFLNDSSYLADEIDGMIGRLKFYSEAIRENDRGRLMALLRERR